MKGIEIDVSNSIWNWVSAVAMNTDNRTNLELWKSGKKQPTFNQLEKFSIDTRIPIGYFFLSKPPVENLKLLEFRTIDSLAMENPSRNLLDTIRQMENVQDWMREYIINTQGEKNAFVGLLNVTDDIMNIASVARKILSLPLNWYEQVQNAENAFKIFRNAMSSIGIIVMMNGIVGANTHRVLDIEEFRAFALTDEFAPLIFINSTDSKGGMIFSLLHEFIHIGIGTCSLFNAEHYSSNYVNPHEVVCNAVTAEIIVPMQVFKTKWKQNTDEISEKVSALASYFKCSPIVIARRALDNKFISDVEYNTISAQAKQGFKNKQSSGGDYYKTNATRIDHKFLLALDSSLREGKTLFTDAFRLTNTNRTTFGTLVDEVRGERK